MSSAAGEQGTGNGAGAGVAASETSISHSREKISLCCEIILDHFGPIAAQVASTLLQRGRLTLRELSRFLATPTIHAPTGYIPEQDDVSHAEASMFDAWQSAANGASAGGSSSSATSWSTPLKSQRLIQQTLLTLIQHNICWHARALPNGSLVQASMDDSTSLEDAFRGVEYFQINVEEVLPRLRFGAYLNIAEERFGETGLSSVNTILRNGKIRAADVIERVSQQGHDREHVEDIMRDLLYYGYIQPSWPKVHTSARDRRISYEAELVSRTRKILGPKEKMEIAETARNSLTNDDYEVWFSSKREEKPVRRGLGPRKVTKKRKPNGRAQKDAKGSKKAKATNGKPAKRTFMGIELSEEEDGGEEGTGPKSFSIDDTIYIRINHDRFDVHLRDEFILRTVEARYNSQLARIVQVMLHLCTGAYDTIPSARDIYSNSLHVNTLRQKMPLKMGLKDAFDHKTMKEKLGSDASHDSALLGEAIAILVGGGDESRTGQARRMIGPSEFARPNKHMGGYSQIQIEYRNAARLMRHAILRTVIEAQFGANGLRVITLLQDLGKLDEKQISKVCLISMSETRDVCARLFAAGLLSLQEIPKASERVAARSFFFWYVDEKKCISWLSDHLCKSLARLTQRRRHEQAREADLVVKSQRIDVKMDETLLRDVERIRLHRLQETVNIISLAELRAWQDLFIVSSLPE
ncbi:uncharacterized protein FA14DRAFT_160177 [Meira miltonrushii]|uniref:DNA-directed RNA polymerase III subunit RPC3 n=1 Tax=Meira miltonrushii TaxID=1280837 RepID=A0A316VF78_9BASI|nr:uncharacterized protein FA14DRAFT_160177 [Meira miltonrushii]PWN34671.1 hypothetical protein FA14DRAFT_160177 [Meira miltonrushii]